MNCFGKKIDSFKLFHILPYLKFEGGSFEITSDAVNLLNQL